ncbi:hypothetical protein PV326_010724 [Microctonus aethiopoides]|nr:hypothetical protein PV326_010724 [Microctonus aethiopoides]
MSVHYKFKSALDYDTVSFDGLHISVSDLKKAIFHQERIGKNMNFDLQITNAQTKEEYTDDNALIAKNTSLIISRVPLTVQQKRSWDRSESQAFANSKDESNSGNAVDLTRLDGSEDDKIRAMITQSTQDYDPSNYMKIRGSSQTGEVPPNYVCYKCYQPGHWIKNCPLSVNQEPVEVKKSTGIPRSFMVPVEGPQVPGAMITPTGQYAVPAIDHQAYKEGKKERPPFFQDPEPVVKKPEIPDDLICNICKDVLTDAVTIPCCGNPFCDECIRTFLLESEEHDCPLCTEKDILPDTLIPNRFLRNAVTTFKAKQQVDRLNAQATVSETEKSESQSTVNQTESKEIAEESPTKPVAEDPVPDPPQEPITSETREPSVESNLSNNVAPVVADEETEVTPPPPPGTEPLFPIQSTNQSPQHVINEQNKSFSSEKTDYENDYTEEECHQDHQHSFENETRHDRIDNNRNENLRSINRQRTPSPRNTRCNDYSSYNISPSRLINPRDGGYDNLSMNNSARYAPNVHYETELRRPGEDRSSTPTVDEPHLHSQPPVNQAPLIPYPPGEGQIAPIPQLNYNQPPPNILPHNPPLLPDPYMNHPVPPMYHHQPRPHGPYGPPRYNRPPYHQQSFRMSQPPRNFNGMPRPMRGMHHMNYRGMHPQPLPLNRNIRNGSITGVIDDPLEAFERMLREKDERDRRLGKHRRRSRSRSRTRSYTRSRSRSFGRRSPLSSRKSRSRSPPLKRRASRSPLPHKQRSRTPKRRSRSGSFSISRSRSYSRSQSPRGSISRDRDRDRDRDLPSRYRSPVKSPPRFQRDRDRDRAKSRESREGYNSYYNESSANDYGARDRERDLPPNRERSGSRYPPRTQSSLPNVPPPQSERKDYYDFYNRIAIRDVKVKYSVSRGQTLIKLRLAASTITHGTWPIPPVDGHYNLILNSAQSHEVMDHLMKFKLLSTSQHWPFHISLLRNQPVNQRYNNPSRDPHFKRFDDVAPPGTEGCYDFASSSSDHPQRSVRDDRDRSRMPKEQEDREHIKHSEIDNNDRLSVRDDRTRIRDDRPRERDERDRRRPDRSRDQDRERDRDKEERDRIISHRERDDRIREKDNRDRSDKDVRDERYVRENRDDDRQAEKKDYEKERYRDDYDRGIMDDKNRDRHDKPPIDRKKIKKSTSPHFQKQKNEVKTLSPDRAKKKDKDHHDDKLDEKKKDKKAKDKKKKKNNDEKEKKKKKKKDKKLLQKEVTKPESTKFLSELENLSGNIKIEEATSSQVKTPDNIESNQPESIKNDDALLPSSLGRFEEKSLIMNPEPPEIFQQESSRQVDVQSSRNPSNPNFKPIPKLKADSSPINSPQSNKDSEINDRSLSLEVENKNKETNETNPEKLTTMETEMQDNQSDSNEEFDSKDELKVNKSESTNADTLDDEQKSETMQINLSSKIDTSKTTKNITSEISTSNENITLQKTVRPIEIKKISESRKILYQNPEQKTLGIDLDNESKRSVDATSSTVGNERNIEVPLKKSKLDRSKFKMITELTHSPTRLSAKERLGEKVEDNKEIDTLAISMPFVEERTPNENDNIYRAHPPKLTGERKQSPLLGCHIELPALMTDRKVFLDHDRIKKMEKSEQRTRIPSPLIYKHGESIKLNFLKRKKDNVDDSEIKKEDRKLRNEKKRKKEHRNRSKSRDRKKRKDKKHKKDKEKAHEKKSKHKYMCDARDISRTTDNKYSIENIESSQLETSTDKQRQIPLLLDRRRSVLDEASFEPDYSATDSESDIDDSKIGGVKKLKLEDRPLIANKEIENKISERRIKSSSPDDDSSSSTSSSTESDSSNDSHKKRKRKHKKHKKRKSAKKGSSSDSDSDSDSSDSSSNDDKHKRKSKKSKAKIICIVDSYLIDVLLYQPIGSSITFFVPVDGTFT